MPMSTSSTATSGGIAVAETEALPLSPSCTAGDDSTATTPPPRGKFRLLASADSCLLRPFRRNPLMSSIREGHERRRRNESSSSHGRSEYMKVRHQKGGLATLSSRRPSTRLLSLLAWGFLCILVAASVIRPEGAGETLFHPSNGGTGSIPSTSSTLIIDGYAERENEDRQHLRRRLFRDMGSIGGAGGGAGIERAETERVDAYREHPDRQQQQKHRFSPSRILASWAEFPSTTTTNNDSSTSLQPPSLLPLSSNDLWGLALAVVGLMLAAGGGVGGGGILVPIYTLVLRFSPRHAIPLSNVTVFGGAVANAILNSRKRHPFADRPLVDWDLMLVMEPLTICGALIGSFVNKTLPEILLLVSMVLLLSFTANNTLRKAKRMYEKETEDMRALAGMTMEADAECVGKADNVDNVCHHERMPHQEEKKEPLLPRQRSSSSAVATDSAEHEKQPQRSNDGAGEGGSTRSWSAPLESGERHGDANSQVATDYDPASKCQTTQLGEVELVEYSNAHKDCGDSGTKEKDEKVVVDDCGSTTTKQVQEPGTVCGLRYEPTGTESTTTTSGVVDLLLEEERHSPPKNVGILCGMFLVVIVVNILKGGGAFSPLGIACGSTPFWIAEIFLIVWILAVFAVARSYLVQRAELKRRVGYQYVEGDIEWTPQATVIYPAICWVAGFFAGMFGIGGGIVKGPLMLAMGIHPAVASATSACMILFTSLVATTSYTVFGLLIPDYAAACLGVGFFATLLGQKVMSLLLKRYGRNSYIAFSIGIVVLLSAVCMTADSVVSIIRERELEAGGDEDAVGDAGGLCSIVE